MSYSLKQLIGRNIRIYFKDKSTFFSSLITPMILFVLFVTFLGRVYEDSLLSIIPESIKIDDKLLSSFTISWLLSSIVGTCSVTVAFCSNIIMAQDKINGARGDLLVSPVKKSTLALSYYFSNVISTLIVMFVILIIGFVYIATVNWYYTAFDVIRIIADTVVCVLFGTSLAALVECSIKTNGGIGAVSSLVSSLYGFICGAYMPIAQFSSGIRNLISCLPGTYSVVLLKNHFLVGVLDELAQVIPTQMLEDIKDGFDINAYFFDYSVAQWQMYTVLGVSIVFFIGLYIFVNYAKNKKKA